MTATDPKFEELLDALTLAVADYETVPEQSTYRMKIKVDAARAALLAHVSALRAQRDALQAERDAALDCINRNTQRIVAAGIGCKPNDEPYLLTAAVTLALVEVEKLTAERDAARKELCMEVGKIKCQLPGVIVWRGRDEADVRGWQYLYETVSKSK